jgi:hypothetical protein
MPVARDARKLCRKLDRFPWSTALFGADLLFRVMAFGARRDFGASDNHTAKATALRWFRSRLPISRLHYNSGNLQGRMAGNVPEGSV